jgi:tRNA (guanine37-N1)-methyltransferase
VVLTLFPKMFAGFLDESIVKRAQECGLATITLIDIRQYAEDKHATVDDYPFGGGPGMVLKPEPVFRAVEQAQKDRPDAPVILLTPQGRRYQHRLAKTLAQEDDLIIISGRYKGFDDRIRTLADQEISIGDYVLSGGELAAMVLIDSVTRLIPGVLGDADSAEGDSFFDGLLEGPQFTRPREFRDLSVPDILFSGNHEHIRLWRRKEALRRTLRRRPDLLENGSLSGEDGRLLEEIRREEGDRKEETETEKETSRPNDSMIDDDSNQE